MENGFLTRNQGLDMVEKITGFVKSRTYDRDAIDGLLNDKQDVLNFDNTPTENSTNPVTSGGVYNAISKPDLYEVNIFYDFTLDELKIPTEYTQLGYAVYKNGEDITNTITNFKTFVDNLNDTNNILKFYSVKNSTSTITSSNHRELLRNYMSSTNFVTVFNVYNSDVVGTIRFKTDEITCTFKESTIDIVDRITENTYGCNVHIVLDVTDVPVTDIDLDNLMFANVEDYVQTIKYTKYKVGNTSYKYDTEVTYTDSIIKFINNVLPSLNAHYNLSITVDITKSTGESTWEERAYYAEYINHGVNDAGYYDNYLKLSHDFRASGAGDIYDYPQNSMQYVGLIAVPSVEHPEATSYCKIARVVDTELTENSNNYITSGTMFDIVGNYYTKTETDNLLNDKQDTLTFDTVPTNESENPVTSDGIYEDIHTKVIDDTEAAAVKTLTTAPLPFNSLKVGIEAVQDLHGYDKPWVGGAGNNKLDLADIVTSSAGFVYNRKPINIAVSTYTLSFNFIGSTGSISISLRSGETVVSTLQDQPLVNGLNTYTLPILSNNADSISLYAGVSGTYENFMLNEGSTALPYEPYSNICPISGWDAVNLNECGKNIATTEIYKNNYVLASDGKENYAFGFIITKEIKIDSSKSYYLSMVGEQSSSSDAIRVGFFDKFLNFISRIERSTPTQLTIPDNAEYIRLSYRSDNPYYKDIQLEKGTTATAYEAYNGQTYTIQFKDGSNPLTVYGGTLDVVSGVLTVDRVYFKYTNVSTTSGTAVTDGWRCNFTCPIDDINRGKWSIQPDATPIFDRISSVAKGYGANEYTAILPNVTSKQEADAMLEGLEICYKLATPIAIQLTPTMVRSLLGTTNLWADSGKIEQITYYAGNNAANELLSQVNDNYLPLTGGTITGNLEIDSLSGGITMNADCHSSSDVMIHNQIGYSYTDIVPDDGIVTGNYLRKTNTSYRDHNIVNTNDENTYTLTLPDANGTVALTSDIPTDISELTNTTIYTKTEIDTMIGDISSALDTINGEVV